MSRHPSLIALAVAAACCSSAAFAQSSSSDTATLVVLPTRVVVLPVEQVGSTDPGPQSPAAARKEAAAALAQARTECRKESTAGARTACLADAKADHDEELAKVAAGERA